ncbi:MAG: leucine-rich repeat domain-containing protein [Nonlabens sp.]|uniref:leucine-rich repeat domain-containing protein n=1 Tax=Nonlabens sp. TaxID=1888209 RepID=UPI003EF0D1BA
MKKSLLSILILFTVTIGYGQIFTQNSMEFIVNSGTNTVTVRDYNASTGGVNVVIPSTVTNNNITYTVTEIGYGAFFGGNPPFITTVSFPNTLTTIGEISFSSNQISNLVIPDSVTIIDDYAFQGNLISDVVIPLNVTSIGIGAFRVNPLSSITSYATTAPTITTASNQSDTFYNNGVRETIDLIIPDGSTTSYSSGTGALWTGFNMVFEQNPTISNEVAISDYSLVNGLNLNIPSTVTTASQSYTVTAIADNAFKDDGLTSVTIPNGITEIGISAFENNSLTAVTIPNSVITIGTTAFVTNSISSLTLGDNVSTIGLGAFGFNQLTSVTFPSSVTNIGAVAFFNNLLTDVTSLAITPPNVTTGTNDTFDTRGNINLHIPPGTSADYVTNSGALWINFNMVAEDALSSSDFELDNDIILYTSNNFIKLSFSNQIEFEKYTLYNMAGSQVAQGIESEIYTNSFANGIYIVKLDFDKGTVVKKVVIN